MNCYNHPDCPAIGVCMACGKGLCGGCLRESPDGLLCKDAHEAWCQKQAGSTTDSVATFSKWRLGAIATSMFLFGLWTMLVVGAGLTAFQVPNIVISLWTYVLLLIMPCMFFLPFAIYEFIAGIIRHRNKLRLLKIKHTTT